MATPRSLPDSLYEREVALMNARTTAPTAQATITNTTAPASPPSAGKKRRHEEAFAGDDTPQPSIPAQTRDRQPTMLYATYERVRDAVTGLFGWLRNPRPDRAMAAVATNLRGSKRRACPAEEVHRSTTELPTAAMPGQFPSVADLTPPPSPRPSGAAKAPATTAEVPRAPSPTERDHGLRAAMARYAHLPDHRYPWRDQSAAPELFVSSAYRSIARRREQEQHRDEKIDGLLDRARNALDGLSPYTARKIEYAQRRVEHYAEEERRKNRIARKQQVTAEQHAEIKRRKEEARRRTEEKRAQEKALEEQYLANERRIQEEREEAQRRRWARDRLEHMEIGTREEDQRQQQKQTLKQKPERGAEAVASRKGAALIAAREAREAAEDVAAKQQREQSAIERADARQQHAEDSEKQQLIRPLEQKWVDSIRDAMSKSDRSVVATSVEGIEITRRDLGTLLADPGVDSATGWLNDEIVNAWFSTIVQRRLEQDGYVKGPNNVPAYAAYNTAWVTTFKDRGVAGLKTWSRRKGIAGAKLLQAAKIFFPINAGAHWTLVIISPQARTIEYLDSLHGSPAKWFAAARAWLAMELGSAYDPAAWSDVPARSSAQDNSNDCGAFACFNALAAAKGAPYAAVTAAKMQDARRLMGAILLNGGFKGDFEL